MSRFSPMVQAVPFTGLGDAINEGLNSFLRGQQIKQQRDIEAAQTGVGLTPVSPYDVTPTPPPDGGLSGALHAGLNRLLGRPSPTAQAATQTAQNTATMNRYAADQATDNQHAIASALSGAPQPAPVTQTGLDANGIPLQSRLPSGQILYTSETPYGRQEAMFRQRAGVQYGLQDLKGQQRAQQIGLTTEGRLAVVDEQGQWRDLTTGEQIDAANVRQQMRDNTAIRNHDTVSADAVYRATHPTASGGISPDYRRGEFVQKQLQDTRAQMKADEATLANRLTSRSTPADSAAYNAAGAELPGLRTRADSLRQVLSGIGAGLAGGGSAPATPVTPPGSQPTPADSALAQKAAQRIRSKQASLQEAMASPSLTPGAKRLLQQQFGGTQ